MSDKNQTQARLVAELAEARRRLAEMEALAVELKRTKRAVQEAREYAENIVDTVREPLVVLDADLRVVSASRSFYQTFKVTPEETEGQLLYDLGDRQWNTPKLRELLEDILSKNTSFDDFEIEYDFEHAGPREMRLNARRIYREANKTQLILLAIEDITEQRKVEREREFLLAQVRGQARQLRQIMNTVPEGVLLLDADRTVVTANPVAKEYLVVLAGAQVGDTLTRLGNRPLVELLTSPPTKGLWHEVTTERRSFGVIARPIENGPEPEAWVLVIRDVTREREIRHRLQQQEQLAAVGQLAAGIAHDFNNILAVIVLYTGMGLLIPDLPPKLREHLTTISAQAKRATDLVQQILDFGRRAVLERRPMDLVPFLKEQIKLLERTLPENIEISLGYGTDEYTVNADPTRMQQAIMNLAINARDAMPEGGGLRIGLERIRVERRKEAPLPEMEAGEWVCVTAADTGTGIPPDVLPHIFEPFFTTKVPSGTGLGLAQVHGIVKQHQGEIGVTTDMGEGTTFTIYLPALPLAPLEELPLETEALPRGRGETVLVVEDDAAMREALVDSIELLNYRVLEAANGQEALAILERQAGQVALVLSDLVMPDMGGQALFHALRQRGLTMPVLMFSGHPMENELESLQSQGLAGWLLKPPKLEQLAQLLARALKES